MMFQVLGPQNEGETPLEAGGGSGLKNMVIFGIYVKFFGGYSILMGLNHFRIILGITESCSLLIQKSMSEIYCV